jgi:hypothetical protein
MSGRNNASLIMMASQFISPRILPELLREHEPHGTGQLDASLIVDEAVCARHPLAYEQRLTMNLCMSRPPITCPFSDCTENYNGQVNLYALIDCSPGLSSFSCEQSRGVVVL